MAHQVANHCRIYTGVMKIRTELMPQHIQGKCDLSLRTRSLHWPEGMEVSAGATPGSGMEQCDHFYDDYWIWRWRRKKSRTDTWFHSGNSEGNAAEKQNHAAGMEDRSKTVSLDLPAAWTKKAWPEELTLTAAYTSRSEVIERKRKLLRGKAFWHNCGFRYTFCLWKRNVLKYWIFRNWLDWCLLQSVIYQMGRFEIIFICFTYRFSLLLPAWFCEAGKPRFRKSLQKTENF